MIDARLIFIILCLASGVLFAGSYALIQRDVHNPVYAMAVVVLAVIFSVFLGLMCGVIFGTAALGV